MEQRKSLESLIRQRDERPSLRGKRRNSDALASAIRQTQDAIKKAFTTSDSSKKVRARLKQTDCA